MKDLTVKCFDEQCAEAELKKCPKIVQDYVKNLKGSIDNWKNICADAVAKLRNRSKNNDVSHVIMPRISHFIDENGITCDLNAEGVNVHLQKDGTFEYYCSFGLAGRKELTPVYEA